jgi:hypothetical protein
VYSEGSKAERPFLLHCAEWLARGWEGGGEGSIFIWQLGQFLRIAYSYIHSLKDSDSFKDTQQSEAKLLNWTQDSLTFLFLVSNIFKSFISLLWNHQKNISCKPDCVFKDGIKVNLQRNGEFHGKKYPTNDERGSRKS